MTGMYRWMLVAAAVPSLLLGASLSTAASAWAEGPGSGEVTAVSLAPAAGKTEIVVAVKGAVEVRDFLLGTPDRLVLDVVGATLSSTRVLAGASAPCTPRPSRRIASSRACRRTVVGASMRDCARRGPSASSSR